LKYKKWFLKKIFILLTEQAIGAWILKNENKKRQRK